MRSRIRIVAAFVALFPLTASATLQVNIERVDVVPSGVDQTVFFDVFVVDLDNTNERLNAFSIGIDGPNNTPDGVRFLPPQRPTAHPFVFKDFPGTDPEDFDTTYNRVQAGTSIATTAEVNIVNGTNDGVVRIPVIVPANIRYPVFYPFILDVSVMDFSGNGAPIVFVLGNVGGMFAVPDPSAGALASVAGLALLRRRVRCRATP